MPVLRLNADQGGLAVHASPASADATLRRAAEGTGPVIVMIHGFKYQPGHALHCPHQKLYSAADPGTAPFDASWLRQTGFCAGHSDEGLALAFGWNARSALRQAPERARDAGLLLADAIATLRRCAPHRPVHILTHSMGSEVAFEALHHLAPGDVSRVIALTAASYRSRAEAAMASPAGAAAELLNVTSGENDLFDAAFERLIHPPRPGDRALGAGVGAANAVTIQLDCHSTLHALASFAAPIAPPRRRICHWSCYTRPGALQFYGIALRHPERVPLKALRHALPAQRQPRYAPLFRSLSAPGALPYPATEAS